MISEKPVIKLDFEKIKNEFRLHIHQRRNMNSSELVLLDNDLIEDLKVLKHEIFTILDEYRKLNETTKCNKEKDLKTFSSLNEFANYVVNQQEILNSEILKLESIHNYLNQLPLIEPDNESSKTL